MCSIEATATISALAGLLQDQIISEAHFMKGLLHPNLLPLYCSFIDGTDLWLVTPFIAAGTLASILASRCVLLQAHAGSRVCMHSCTS